MSRRDYSGTPLPKKLGIKEGHSVAFVSEPAGFPEALGPLPPGVEVGDAARPPLDVAVLFATRRAELERSFTRLAAALDPTGGLWVVWPKKASSIQSKLSFEIVQRIGLGAGLVDNKSASIDADWQGLRFVVRKEDREDWPLALRRSTTA